MEDKIKLTSYSHGFGCGCKIAPNVLEEILANNRSGATFSNLIVGNDSSDDAAVVDIGNGMGLISTTDFFMPIVDDPYDFGRIAATNAISDIYAMGGTPNLALSIFGWPIDKLSAAIANKVIEGGRYVCAEVGIPLAGGHSIDSPEPIFGLAVNGTIPLKNIKRNNTAKLGDLLFLTKPLGVGIITTAFKMGKATDELLAVAIQQMTTLNKIGAVLGAYEQVHAMTDVTGFGLFGHLIEMAEGSNLSAEISYVDLPVLQHIKPLMDQYCIPAITYRNWNSYGEKVSEIGADELHLGCDPQTSGGLLIAVDPKFETEILSIFESELNNNIAIKPIGKMIAKGEKVVVVKS
jgi:selenide,water dikinase